MHAKALETLLSLEEGESSDNPQLRSRDVRSLFDKEVLPVSCSRDNQDNM